MAVRFDASPQSRLRHLARDLSLSERQADEVLARSRGDLRSAEQMLRNMTLAKARQPCATLSRDDRIRKCAASLAQTPDALSLLHTSLTKVLAEPHNERLRKVNMSQGVFHTRVASRNPAGVELLFAVGYEPMHGHLVLQRHDPVILTAALNALTAAKETPAYLEANAVRMEAHRAASALVEETAAADARRAFYLTKVPAEPDESEIGGAASTCVITIGVAAGVGQSPARVATRRFDSDNTLEDLVNYVRSLQAVSQPDGALTVANVTTRPKRILDPASEGQASLYALDLWPRGRIEVHVTA